MSFQSDADAASWLAGFFDGEGTVSTNRHARRVSIANTDPELVESCSAALNRLDIRFRIYERGGASRPAHWAKGWDVSVYGYSELVRFGELVPFRCSKKRERLDEMLASFKLRYVTRDRIPVEDLRCMYWNENYSCQMLAEHYDVSLATVSRWMTVAEIPRRSNSEATKLRWQIRRGETVAL